MATMMRAETSQARSARPEDRQIFEQILSDFTNEKGRLDLLAAFKAHPGWAEQLNWNNPLARGRVYTALNSLKHQRVKTKTNGNGKPHIKRRAGKISWGPEHLQLVKQIQADPAFNNGTGTQWPVAGESQPQAQQLVTIRGRQYTIEELERRLEIVPARFCSECGQNLEWLNKANTVARRHTLPT